MYTNVLEYLEHSAARFGDKPAFTDETATLTFAQALHTARAVGSALARLAPPRSPVAVLMERRALMPVCLLGVVFSGCFYVPIDPDLPEARIRAILEALNAGAALADARYAEFLRSQQPGLPVLTVEDAVVAAEDAALLGCLRAAALETDPLYALFTSGSTGAPKGVVHSHHAVINYMEEWVQAFGTTSEDVFGGQSPFDFSISVKDLYASTKCGATLVVIPRQYFAFPARLVDCLNRFRVSVIFWSVSAVILLANLKAFERDKPRYLRSVLFSGELMPMKHLNYWRRHLPDVTYYSLYGSTEVNGSCYYRVPDGALPDDFVLPMGHPYPNREMLVLNERDARAAPDEIGELCVRGGCLACGYYNNPEQTARVFTQNPLNPHYPEIIYRTGDLARYNQAGELVYCGRKDQQVKHQGRRVELGEIESAAYALEGVRACCCLYDEQRKTICLVHESALSDEAILAGLRERLPRYMLPQRIVALEKMPLTSHGKVDRMRLKELYVHVQP